jgi:hypothetical protein
MRTRTRRIILAVAMPTLALLAVMLGGCISFGPTASTEHPMVSAAGVPASEGTVNVTKGDNNNTLIEVHVKHLAPPWKVASGATTYVVWIQPLNGVIENVGGMDVDSDLAGTLKTVTPYHAFKLTVTPEPNSAIAQPTHKPVFTADITSRMSSDQ